MKQGLSPIVVCIAILATIGIAALVWMTFGASSHNGSKENTGMPKEVQAEFQRRMETSPTPQGAAAGAGNAPVIPPPMNTH
jgi:hypothetical protein